MAEVETSTGLAPGPVSAVSAALELGFEQHRRELTGYCYRMLGSAFEAEDAVQETLLRAWRAADRFEGRSALKSWLYRIATNVCLDMLAGTKRRARPMDLGPASSIDGSLGRFPRRHGSSRSPTVESCPSMQIRPSWPSRARRCALHSSPRWRTFPPVSARC